jgi:hypothetical protein
MKKIFKNTIYLIALVFALATTSCREKTTGEKIEDAVESVGDDVKDAVDDVGDEIEDVVDDNE